MYNGFGMIFIRNDYKIKKNHFITDANVLISGYGMEVEKNCHKNESDLPVKNRFHDTIRLKTCPWFKQRITRWKNENRHLLVLAAGGRLSDPTPQFHQNCSRRR
jgi:hypothetical protein